MLQSYFLPDLIEAGCDEAGRGCLAGPVVAAAVILPRDWENDKLNDSKQLSEAERLLLRNEIEAQAIDYKVAFIYQQEIDAINILSASIKAMHHALDGLKTRPQHIIIDGNRFRPYQDIPYATVVKGDGKYASIAAASILAKTYRDEYMESLHQEFPHYGWNTNKGYPTIKHRTAIKEYGPCKHHRMSFQLLPIDQLKLF